jgi:hypothetical protein
MSPLPPRLDYQNSSSKNVVRINNINDFLQEDEQQQQEGMSFMPVDKPTLVEVNFDGAVLPLELRPGDNQPRIPDFVLQNSVLSDPRDLVAYRNLMKPHKTIEVN